MLEELQSRISKAAESVTLELSAVENMHNSYSTNLQFIEGLLHYSKPEELIDLQAVISKRFDSVNCVSYVLPCTQ